MAKKEPDRARHVLATLKDERYRVNLFFNRFSVETLGKHVLLHVGLSHGRSLLASYACVLEAPMLEASRDSMLSFLDAISDASDVENEVWQPPSDCQGVEACNIMHMARTGEIGEVRLGLFSTGVAIEGRKSSQVKFEVAANPLALLRCDLEVQKRLLLALYVDRTSDA